MIRSLIGHLLDFLYWVAAIVGLVLLGPNIESAPLLIVSMAIYATAVVGIYFFVLRRIKRHLG